MAGVKREIISCVIPDAAAKRRAKRGVFMTRMRGEEAAREKSNSLPTEGHKNLLLFNYFANLELVPILG